MQRSHGFLWLLFLILVGGLAAPALSPSAGGPATQQSLGDQLTYF